MRTIRSRGFAVALVVGVLGVVTGEGWAQQSPPPATAPATATPAAPMDLSGSWQLDPAHSDMPPSGGGGERGGHGGGGGGHHHGGGGYGGGGGGYGGGGYGGGGGGGWGGHHGGPGGPPEGANAGSGGGGGGRGVRLPEQIHITQTPTLVSFEDSTGTVLQEIATVAAAADTMTRAPGALHVAGSWDGKSLTVTRDGPRGKVKETWQLEKSGQALDQVIAFDSEQGSRTMKRVYRRIVEP